MSNNTSLTRVLVGLTKWSGKSSFTFFVLTALIIAGTVSLGGPVVNYYSVAADQTMGFDYALENDNIQFGIVVDNGDSVTLELFRVQYLHIMDNNETVLSDYQISDADAQSLDLVFTMTAHEFFRDLQLDEGDYRFVISTSSATDFTFGVGQFMHGLIALSAVFITIFSVVFAIFNTVWPFALMVLIINAITGSIPSKSRFRHYKRAPAAHQAPVAPAAVQPPAEQVLPRPVKVRRTSGSSLFDGFTNNDWGALMIGAFFIFIFFVNPDGPFFFIAIVIIIGAIYNVNERERNRNRLLVLLAHYPVTSVDFLTEQIYTTRANSSNHGKKKRIIKVLQFMILDEGLPIQLDLATNMVKVIGKLPTSNLDDAIQSTAPSVTVQEPVAPVAPVAPVEPVAPAKPVEPVAPAKAPEPEEDGYFCSGCGEKLVGKTKYCYYCGQKTN